MKYPEVCVGMQVITSDERCEYIVRSIKDQLVFMEDSKKCGYICPAEQYLKTYFPWWAELAIAHGDEVTYPNSTASGIVDRLELLENVGWMVYLKGVSVPVSYTDIQKYVAELKHVAKETASKYRVGDIVMSTYEDNVGVVRKIEGRKIWCNWTGSDNSMYFKEEDKTYRKLSSLKPEETYTLDEIGSAVYLYFGMENTDGMRSELKKFMDRAREQADLKKDPRYAEYLKLKETFGDL